MSATHGLVSAETRVFPVKMRATTITMEKIKRQMEATYLNATNGVILTSWASSWDCCLVASTSVIVAIVLKRRGNFYDTSVVYHFLFRCA